MAIVCGTWLQINAVLEAQEVHTGDLLTYSVVYSHYRLVTCMYNCVKLPALSDKR